MLQRPRRFGRNRNLFAGVPTLRTLVDPLMKLPGTDTNDDEHTRMRAGMKAQRQAMKASTSKTTKKN